MDNLTWLEYWYYFQCDGSWESVYGISISLNDSFNWEVTFDIENTKSMDKEFREVVVNNSDYDWLKAYVIDNVFYFKSTIQNLPIVLEIFRLGVQGKSEKVLELPKEFMWFLDWCRKERNHIGGKLRITTIENPGWELTVPLIISEFESKKFKIDRSEEDWVYCSVKNGEFQGYCGPLNLLELFSAFRSFISS